MSKWFWTIFSLGAPEFGLWSYSWLNKSDSRRYAVVRFCKNHSCDYRLNWTPLSTVTITYRLWFALLVSPTSYNLIFQQWNCLDLLTVLDKSIFNDCSHTYFVFRFLYPFRGSAQPYLIFLYSSRCILTKKLVFVWNTGQRTGFPRHTASPGFSLLASFQLYWWLWCTPEWCTRCGSNIKGATQKTHAR